MRADTIKSLGCVEGAKQVKQIQPAAQTTAHRIVVCVSSELNNRRLLLCIRPGTRDKHRCHRGDSQGGKRLARHGWMLGAFTAEKAKRNTSYKTREGNRDQAMSTAAHRRVFCGIRAGGRAGARTAEGHHGAASMAASYAAAIGSGACAGSTYALHAPLRQHKALLPWRPGSARSLVSAVRQPASQPLPLPLATPVPLPPLLPPHT